MIHWQVTYYATSSAARATVAVRSQYFEHKCARVAQAATVTDPVRSDTVTVRPSPGVPSHCNSATVPEPVPVSESDLNVTVAGWQRPARGPYCTVTVTSGTVTVTSTASAWSVALRTGDRRAARP